MPTFAEAFDRLKSGQKSARGVSLYSRFVNRPAGRVFASAGYVLRMSPNGMTAASAVVTACGVLLIAIAPPSWPLGVGVWLLLCVGFMLDSADGQLARLTGRGSRQGEWLDHVVDAGKVVVLHSAVLVHWYRFYDPERRWVLLIPLVVQLAAVVTFAGGTLADLLLRSSPAGAPARSPSTLRAVLLLPADYGVFVMVFVLLGAPHAFVVGYAALGAVQLVAAIGLGARWFRTLGASGTTT